MVARHLNGPLTDRYAGYTAWRGVASIAIAAELAGETMGPGVEVGHVLLGADRIGDQHAALGRDADIARLLSKMAEGSR